MTGLAFLNGASNIQRKGLRMGASNVQWPIRPKPHMVIEGKASSGWSVSRLPNNPASQDFTGSFRRQKLMHNQPYLSKIIVRSCQRFPDLLGRARIKILFAPINFENCFAKINPFMFLFFLCFFLKILVFGDLSCYVVFYVLFMLCFL